MRAYDAATAAINANSEEARKRVCFHNATWGPSKTAAGKAGTEGGDQWADHNAHPENAVSVFGDLFASRLDGFADDAR